MSMMQKFNYQEGIAYAVRQIRFMMLEGKSVEEALLVLEESNLHEMQSIRQWFKGMSDALEVMNREQADDIRKRRTD